MSEVRQEVKMYIVNKTCNECHKGIMNQIKINIIEDAITYIHKCNNCGVEEILHQGYPRIEYENINKEE
jgi:ribosomal protein L19